jgi:flagellar basal body-associated protein FliL
MANDEILNDDSTDLEKSGKPGSKLRIAIAIALLILIVGTGFIAAENGVSNSLNIVSPSTSNGPTYTISASPNVIAVGSSVSLTAAVSGFSGYSQNVIQVTITVNGPPGSQEVSTSTGTITTNSVGYGSVTLHYPSGFSSGSTAYVGLYTVSASFSYDYPIGTATTSFLVLKVNQTLTPTLSISPGHGPAGTTVQIYGDHFAPSATINITLAGSLISTSPSTITSTSSGSFTGSIAIPSSASGTVTITAKDSYGNSVSLPFIVESSSIPGPLNESGTVTYIANGYGYANLSDLNFVVIIESSSSPTYTPITVLASLYSGEPSSVTQATSTTTLLYYDLKITGTSTGNALISITNSKITSSSVGGIQYWTGSSWDSASQFSVTGNTASGLIPVSALTGTPIALVAPTPPVPVSILLIAIIVIVVVVIVVVAILIIMRNRKGKGPGKMKSKETSNVSKGMSKIEQIPLEKK